MSSHGKHSAADAETNCATTASPVRQGQGSLADAIHGARAEVTEARHRLVVQLVEAGAGLHEIAAALGVTREDAFDLAWAVQGELLKRRLRVRLPVRTDDPDHGRQRPSVGRPSPRYRLVRGAP